MPNEEAKELNDSQTAGDGPRSGEAVSDDDLNRAWDEAVTGESAQEAETKEQPAAEDGNDADASNQEKGEEAPKEEGDGKDEEKPPADTEKPPKEGDEEHKERTKLGRKVAKLEDTLSQVLEQNRILLEKLTAQPAQQAETQPQEDEYVDLTSPDGLRQFLARERQAEAARAANDQVKYQAGYVSSLKGWQEGADDEGEAAEIFALLTDTKSPFNVRYSADPQADFERNLSKATAHYWKTKATSASQKRDNPLDKNRDFKPKAPLGVPADAKADAGKAAPTIKLDKDSEELVKKYGWSMEEVAAALQGDTPMHLRRGR